MTENLFKKGRRSARNRKSQKLVSLVENDRKSFLKDLRGMLGGNRKSQKLVSLVENDRKSFQKDLGVLDGNRKSKSTLTCRK